MLAANFREKYISNLEANDFFDARLSIMHVDGAIQNHEYLFPIIHVPLVWLVSPMQANGRSTHVGYICSTPGPHRRECLAANNFHQ